MYAFFVWTRNGALGLIQAHRFLLLLNFNERCSFHLDTGRQENVRRRSPLRLHFKGKQNIGWRQVKGIWVEVKGVTKGFSITIEFSITLFFSQSERP